MNKQIQAMNEEFDSKIDSYVDKYFEVEEDSNYAPLDLPLEKLAEDSMKTMKIQTIVMVVLGSLVMNIEDIQNPVPLSDEEINQPVSEEDLDKFNSLLKNSKLKNSEFISSLLFKGIGSLAEPCRQIIKSNILAGKTRLDTYKEIESRVIQPLGKI